MARAKARRIYRRIKRKGLPLNYEGAHRMLRWDQLPSRATDDYVQRLRDQLNRNWKVSSTGNINLTKRGRKRVERRHSLDLFL